jgi:indolepyruvate ferredoxin oxidoreductase
MTLAEVSLDDKYAKDRGRIYLTGIQALVRLPMLQHERDRAAARASPRWDSMLGGSRARPDITWRRRQLAHPPNAAP